jgi:hypothetical protein
VNVDLWLYVLRVFELCASKTVNKLMSSTLVVGLRHSNLLLETQYLRSRVYQSKLLCQHFTFSDRYESLSMMDATMKVI